MTKIIYALLFYAVAILVGYLCKNARKRKEPIARVIFWLLLVGTLTIAAYAVSMSTNHLFSMSICHSIVFSGIDYMVILVLSYAIELTSEKRMPKKLFYGLLAVAVVDTVSLLSNPWHEKTLTYALKYYRGDVYFSYQPKLPYELHLIFCYVMVFAVFLVLLRKCLKVPLIYSTRYVSVLTAFLLVIFINFIFLFGFVRLEFDASILTYGLLACAIYYLTFDYRPLLMIRNIRNVAVDKIRNPIVLFDNTGKLADFNEDAGEKLGLKKKDIETLSKERFEKEFLQLERCLLDGIDTDMEIRLTWEEEEIWYQATRFCMRTKKERLLGDLYVLHDITDQKKMYWTLEQQAMYDQLTGIYNKHTFYKKLENYEAEEFFPVSIMVCNINGLKLINDVFGSDEGDRLIQYVTNTIKEALGEEQLLGRLDGDETVVVLPRTEEKEAVAFFERIEKQIELRSDFEFEVNVEYGISTNYNLLSDLREHIVKARNHMLRKKMLNSKSVRSSIVESLKKTLSTSDYETEEHAERTKEMAVRLGKRLGLEDREISDLELLAVLHDIGKLSVPDAILSKPTRLTPDEWEIMKLHTVRGFQIAESTQELSGISQYILCHHERYDGKGYPSGLKGEEIPLLSRIISIVDSHDVMVHDRPYHTAISEEDAIKEIRRCSGTQFDPKIAEVFIEMLQEEMRA